MKKALIALTPFFVLGKIAFAQSLTDPLGGGETFTSVASSIAGFLFFDVATPLCVLMVLVGAFQMMTSAGDPEKFSKGRKTLLYAAIGFVVALCAGGLVNLIKGLLGAQ